MAAPEWTVERHLEAGSEAGRALWHYFRVSSIDDEFAGWIHDAYEQVGCGRR